MFKTPKSKESHQIAMSADSESKFIPDTSQGDFWGGYKSEFFWYKALAIFPITGLLGTDHLLLRSPFTAVLKFLVNICFYGAWYFYDIIQILMDSEFIAKYGMSAPWGPKGHGYRFFKDVTTNNLNEFAKPSPQSNGFLGSIAFIFYALFSIYMPFTGIPSAIAGDWLGFGMKVLSLLFIVTIPYYMISGVLEYFRSGDLEKVGVPRSWPVQFLARFLFHDDSEFYPAVNLLPKEEADLQLKAHTEKLGVFKKQQTTKTPGVTAWEAFYGWATGPVRMMSAVANSTEAAAKIGDAGVKGTAAAGDLAALQVKKQELELKQLEQAVPTATTTTTTTTPSQQGGGFLQLPSNQATHDLDMIVLGGIAVLVVGGFAVTLVRKMMVPKRIEEDEYPRKTYGRDDTPPNPGGV
jgi:hypothetical protein